MKKLIAFVLLAVMMFSLGVSAFADDKGPLIIAPAPNRSPASSSDIVVYHTNDIHSYIDQDNNYAKLAALHSSTANSLLVDAGDHIQGTAYGGMDKGATIVALMEAAGYDLATLGNHEFDYGMARALEVATGGKVPYVSCNFYNEKDGVVGAPVLAPYKVFDVKGTKIAFIGITTPETFTKSTPKYFQDEAGNYIYGIAGGLDGAALYTAVQKAIDDAAKEADVLIALGHLGDDPASDPWNSEDVIANTAGLDAFIDGHSHSAVAGKEVTDKAGNTVILAQTGNYFDQVGKLSIAPDGSIRSELISLGDVVPDADVAAINDAWTAEVDTLLDQKIAETEIDFTINFANGDRAIRSAETNMGDLNADAYYWMGIEAGLEPDMAIMNGGGIRASIPAGDWTYKSCKTVNTFGNVLCVVEVTGQQILDALEFGARFTTGDPENRQENGGFLHVAGCTYTVDTAIENGVVVDEKNVWVSGPEVYRVRNVKVYNRTTGNYDALDPEKTYRVCGTNYTLYDCGDGFNMFQGGKHVLDGIAEDYMAMASYLMAFEDGKISSATSPLAVYEGYLLNYENAGGAGRITLTDGNPFADVADDAYYKDAVMWAVENGITNGRSTTSFAPDAPVTREEAMTFIYRYAKTLGDGFTGAWYFPLDFEDALVIESYADEAVHWGYMKKIVNGDENNCFQPAAEVTRQDVVAMLYRYIKNVNGEGYAPGESYASVPFEDLGTIADYAVEGVQWCWQEDIVKGATETSFEPLGTCTRAQIVTYLYRYAF